MVGMFLSLLLFAGNCPKCPPGKIKVAVFELNCSGIDKELLVTISDLLRIDMEDCGEYIVMNKADMLNALNDSLSVNGGTEEVSKVCEKIGVSYAVTGNIVKLGNKLIISVGLIDRWEKIRIFEDKVTASSIEDLDATIKNLAKALCTQKKISESINVDNITEADAKPKLRRESYSTGGIMLGYIFPMSGSLGKEVKTMNYYPYRVEMKGDLRAIPGIGSYYIYETSYYMGQASGTWYFKGETVFMDIGFSGYRFLSLADISPFVGGGLGMTWGSKVTGVDSSLSWDGLSYNYETHRESFDGMSANVGAGVEFLRTYDFHFLLTLKYTVIFAEGNPNGPSIYFGMTYKKSGGGGIGNCCAF
ncbi:MAG: hypothetical protein PHE49_04605 [bacterium]|nr:hypothetical protein [bacterium]